MDINTLNGISSLNLSSDVSAKTSKTNNNTAFEDLFQSALSMINETNELSNAAKKEEIAYSTGLSDDALALQTAQTKASVSLQYTIAVRNKVLEAYNQIMNLQF